MVDYGTFKKQSLNNKRHSQKNKKKYWYQNTNIWFNTPSLQQKDLCSLSFNPVGSWSSLPQLPGWLLRTVRGHNNNRCACVYLWTFTHTCLLPCRTEYLWEFIQRLEPRGSKREAVESDNFQPSIKTHGSGNTGILWGFCWKARFRNMVQKA